MRYVGLLLLILLIPVLTMTVRSRTIKPHHLWLMLSASPFVINWAHLEGAIVSWAMWPGYVKGLLIALPDALAIVIIMTTPRIYPSYSLIVLFIIYIIAASVSIIFSNVWMASGFFTWQLLRALLMCAAIARIASRPNGPRFLVYGLSAGLIFQALFSVADRLHGQIQAGGTMGHQNLLGMMTHFGFLSALGLILGGDKRVLPKLGCLAALIILALSGSRGATGFGILGAIMLVFISLLRRPTSRKMSIAGLGALAMMVAAPVAYLTFQVRAERGVAMSGSDEERDAFERAANAMWNDHPWGVGANNYVVVANANGYANRAGVVWNSGSRSANVHNVYLLIGAETGYLGLVAFVILYAAAIFAAFQIGLSRYIKNTNQDLAIALGVTFIVVALHNFFEWIFVMEPVQYLFGLAIGMVIGLQSLQKSKLNERLVQDRLKQMGDSYSTVKPPLGRTEDDKDFANTLNV